MANTKKSKSLNVGAVVASLGAIFAFLGGLVKVLSYFFDPEERKRKRRQDAINENKHDLNDVCNSIDNGDEDKLNDALNDIEGRRKKDSLKKSLKKDKGGKKKCDSKKKLRYSPYC